MTFNLRTKSQPGPQRPSHSPSAAFTALTLMLGFTACVSVQLGPPKPAKAKGVVFAPPNEPFAEIESPGADNAWQNKRNGNTISFNSLCNDPADPSLETIEKDLLSDFQDLNVLRTQNTTFSGRDALNAEAEGKIDGVKTRLELLVFKKNDCTYSLTYVGVAKSYGSDQDNFHHFLTGFQAP